MTAVVQRKPIPTRAALLYLSFHSFESEKWDVGKSKITKRIVREMNRLDLSEKNYRKFDRKINE